MTTLKLRAPESLPPLPIQPPPPLLARMVAILTRSPEKDELLYGTLNLAVLKAVSNNYAAHRLAYHILCTAILLGTDIPPISIQPETYLAVLELRAPWLALEHDLILQELVAIPCLLQIRTVAPAQLLFQWLAERYVDILADCGDELDALNTEENRRAVLKYCHDAQELWHRSKTPAVYAS